MTPPGHRRDVGLGVGESPGLHPPHRCGPLRFSPAAGGASGDLRGTGGRGGRALGRTRYGRVFVPVRAGAPRGRRGRAVLTRDRAAPAALRSRSAYSSSGAAAAAGPRSACGRCTAVTPLR